MEMSEGVYKMMRLQKMNLVFLAQRDMHGWLHACFGIGLLEDLEPKGEGREGDSVTGLLLYCLQLREGGIVNQLQQMAIQSHLSGRERMGKKRKMLYSCLSYR